MLPLNLQETPEVYLHQPLSTSGLSTSASHLIQPPMHELVHYHSERENVRFVVVPLATEHLWGHVQVAAGLARQLKLLSIIQNLWGDRE